MHIIDITNIEREPGYIYYRRTYHGEARVELPLETTLLSISFTIEMDPLGKKEVELTLRGDVDYPLLPLRKALKEFIIDMDNKDKLTC